MRNIRVVWSFLALAVGGFAVFALYVASWPQYQFTSCEVDPGYDQVTCNQSLIDRGGAGYVAAMVLPALLCTVPVLVPRRSAAWATVGALVVTALVAFVLVGGVAMMPAAAALPAIVLAGLHTRLATNGTAAPSISAQVLLDQVHHRQRGQ